MCRFYVLGGKTEEADSKEFERDSLHLIELPRTTQHRNIDSKILDSLHDTAKGLNPSLNKVICCFPALHQLSVA